MVRSIGRLLAEKTAFSVSPSDSIETVAQKMAEADESAAAVLENGAVVGIVSEKDIVQLCVAKGADPKRLTASRIMTRDPVMIDAGEPVAAAIDKMVTGRFHHLPVMRADAYIGMVCTDDIPEEYRALLEHFRELRAGIAAD